SQNLGLKDRVTFLKEKLSERDYYKLLATSKFVVMAHHRQQGVGNITASLYYGSTTIVRKTINVNGEERPNPVWSRFTSKDVQSLIDFEAFKNASCLKDMEITEAHRRSQKDFMLSISGDELVESTIKSG